MGNTFTDRSQMYSKFAPKLAIDSNNYKQIPVLFDISTTVIWTRWLFFMIEMFANMFITSNSKLQKQSVVLAATLMEKKKTMTILNRMMNRTRIFFV